MIFMSIVEIFEKFCDDAREYAKRSIDNQKLSLIENVSILLGDIACGVVVFMLLFVVFLLLLIIMAAVLLPLIGLLPALFAVVCVTAIVALVVYKMRDSLFVNHFVRRLCGMMFKKDDE